MTAAGSMPSSLEIAQSVKPRPIAEIAREIGILDEELELYGPSKAKVSLAAIERLEATRTRGKYVVVTAITPTPLGEGKTTTTVGPRAGPEPDRPAGGRRIRQPSLGPVFGIKGGAAGGGYSQVIPMEDFNLHLTGDNHAIGAAHNLAAAFLDNSPAPRQPAGNRPGLDPVAACRRHQRPGDPADGHRPGRPENGLPREAEWQITVASEVMAILALATDLQDLRARLGRMVIATTRRARRSPPRTSRSPAR